ncbi:MAG TPA: quinol oxidase [Deltaproteobacteria bacterium]|nr:MAG: quinol oxidase [Deltaproteobacteria bacterium GWA2_55_82]OGQ62160.1 MAG: quinol oxidase [Deltaproteobacteria bacterium RIFCSPLOWO2_02_FULL_55_12]OIJ73352.1 MAG: quinol oxidase [Deltaproteobacteria bacterium GWC2_55_46]HBG45372.1 quinol oxidase [Deltaproteobacteria bacterium]HCY10203.1 quinol oxidase [Deltaproteobacteria bacterium]
MRRALPFLLLFIGLPALLLSKEVETYISRIGATGVQRVEITGGSYFFRPGRIVVKAGVPVELVLKSESAIIPHNFVLKSPEAGIDISVRLEREPTTLRFTPAKSGQLTFYCDKKFFLLKSHREHGMEGTIEVVP